jgi:hypothetical protein
MKASPFSVMQKPKENIYDESWIKNVWQKYLFIFVPC